MDKTLLKGGLFLPSKDSQFVNSCVGDQADARSWLLPSPSANPVIIIAVWTQEQELSDWHVEQRGTLAAQEAPRKWLKSLTSPHYSPRMALECGQWTDRASKTEIEKLHWLGESQQNPDSLSCQNGPPQEPCRSKWLPYEHSLLSKMPSGKTACPKGTQWDSTSNGIWTFDLEVEVLLGREGGNIIREMEIKVLLGSSHLIKRSETSYQWTHQGFAMWN